MSKKYQVVRDCHYINRYWTKDEIVEAKSDYDDFAINTNFVLVEGDVPQETPIVKVPETMYEINRDHKDNAPKTGMAYQPKKEEDVEIVEPRRRGRPPKNG